MSPVCLRIHKRAASERCGRLHGSNAARSVGDGYQFLETVRNNNHSQSAKRDIAVPSLGLLRCFSLIWSVLICSASETGMYGYERDSVADVGSAF